MKEIPSTWDTAGNFSSGIANFFGNLSLDHPYGVGIGLQRADATGNNAAIHLAEIPNVTPLRADGLAHLLDRGLVCAAVMDSMVSINYDPLTGTIPHQSLGLVAFHVLSVCDRNESSELPEVIIHIHSVLEANQAGLEDGFGILDDAPVITGGEPVNLVPPEGSCRHVCCEPVSS